MRWDLRKVVERIRSIVTRGHVTRNRAGDKHRQLHYQYWIDTDSEKIPHLQNAGICANPGTGPDVEAVTLDPEADPSHRIAIVVTSPVVPDCEEGEICIYAPRNPDYKIKINEDGICIETPDGELLQTLIDSFSQLTGVAPGLAVQIAILTAMKC